MQISHRAGLVVVLSLLTLTVVAQPNVDSATLEVSFMYKYMISFSRGMSALCALIGGIKVFNRFTLGDTEVKSLIIRWFGGAMFAFLLPNLVDVLFR